MAKTASDADTFIISLLKRVATIAVSWTTIVVCLLTTLFVTGGIMAIGASTEPTASYSTVYGTGYNTLLSIKVNGMIVGSEEDSAAGFSPEYTAGYTVKERIMAAVDDDTISGIILEINSPGGTIYGSRAIADGITGYQEKTGKPVYAYVEGQAASGAYWAAAATDKIIADYGSDTGSVGVIMGPFQYYDTVIAEDGGLLNGGVITQNGIESRYITAGTSKDAGSPYRRLTTQELAMLQQSVNNEYDGFVAYVSKHRDIPAATLRDTIGAMSYDNKTALAYNLIDHIGSRESAYDALAKEAGVQDDYQVIREDPPFSFWDAALQAVNLKPRQQASEVNLCNLTRSSLAYHGDAGALCNPAAKQ
jgi:protease-4